MSILTAQTVHSRNWMKCPRCDGGAVFTAKDRKQGAICGSCDNRGEVPRTSAAHQERKRVAAEGY
jgi:hypothetical protein